jgi:hypothetical protein
MRLPAEVVGVLSSCPRVVVPRTRQELIELALGGEGADVFEVGYEVPGRGWVAEATVARCRNGAGVNYVDPYMRRRDPDCMVIADAGETEKTRFEERFHMPFAPVRAEILAWLARQKLLAMAFMAGSDELGYGALLVAPVNASFFSAGLADLQGMIPADEIPDGFTPRAFIYLAPPFRHTVTGGQQVVVHNRDNGVHEIFSLNLYPGPSAKKGVYGILLGIGEAEGWITVHGSTVQVTTPYDNVLTIMHEGASGGGKSEMLQHAHREPDGRLLLGENVVTGERRLLTLMKDCALYPVSDDMALAHPSFRNASRLVVKDAEEGWFVRINHITHYGVDPHLERLCVAAPEPLIFLSLHAVPKATILLWEHTEDNPGCPCPNPRVILPRRLVPNTLDGPVEVDVRSFGLRTPPCTRQRPTFGVVGLLHFLPPALAWIWRLVAPRGHANPSITDTIGMTSEGVGSYWPFATGRRVTQANMLLEQIRTTPKTRYTLSPNQHVGAWRTGFMPQWLAREYLARRGGAKFRPGQLIPARCPLLGYTLSSMLVEGTEITQEFLQVNTQPEVGDEAYDAGAAILAGFFKKQLEPYLSYPELDPLGREIIECTLGGGRLSDYEQLLSPYGEPMPMGRDQRSEWSGGGASVVQSAALQYGARLHR